MSFESCFGGFARSKSAPAAMGGKRSFANTRASGEVAPTAVVAGASVAGSCACCHGWRRGGAVGAKKRERSRSTSAAMKAATSPGVTHENPLGRSRALGAASHNQQ